MNAIRRASGAILVLAGLYLVFIELGMAIGESHALRGSNVLVFGLFMVVGLVVAALGAALLRGKSGEGVA